MKIKKDNKFTKSKRVGLGSPLGLVDTLILRFVSNFAPSLPRILRLTIMELFISYILYLLKYGSFPKFWRYLPKKNSEVLLILLLLLLLLLLIYYYYYFHHFYFNINLILLLFLLLLLSLLLY